VSDGKVPFNGDETIDEADIMVEKAVAQGTLVKVSNLKQID
jgi:hypothetical protein